MNAKLLPRAWGVNAVPSWFTSVHTCGVYTQTDYYNTAVGDPAQDGCHTDVLCFSAWYMVTAWLYNGPSSTAAHNEWVACMFADQKVGATVILAGKGAGQKWICIWRLVLLLLAPCWFAVIFKIFVNLSCKILIRTDCIRFKFEHSKRKLCST